MKAGGNSIRPAGDINPVGHEGVEGDEDSDGDEGLEESGLGEACERVKAREEREVVRKLVDPKLPSQGAVDLHWLKGHVEFRNWCDVCIKARGKELDHKRDKGGRGNYLSMLGITVFPGMKWGSGGQCWWGGKGNRRD